MAEAILAHIELEVAKPRPLGDILSELAPEASGESSIETLVDEWLEIFERKVRIGDRQPRTLRDYQRWARREAKQRNEPENHFAWWYGRSIWEIDEASVEGWSYWLAERTRNGNPISAKSRRNILSGFHSFCVWVARKKRKTFEVPRFEWPEVDEHLPTPLAPDLAIQVLSAIPEPKRGIFLLFATAGVRPSEGRVVRISCWTGDEIRISEGAKDRRVGGLVRGTKKRKMKIVPVMPVLKAWLETYVPAERRIAEPTGWLFQNPDASNGGRQWAETTLRRTWLDACKKVGVKVGLYEGTKHTLGTALKALGADDRVIAELFGHSDPRSVQYYAKVQSQTVRSAVAQIDAFSRLKS